MNTTQLIYNEQTDSYVEQQEQLNSPFILGNTQEIGLQQLQDDYLIPVFSRDNTETISHSEFITTIMDAAQTHFQGEQFLTPQVRVSHEMKLRTRTGYGKLVENLTDDDSNSYFQRMMFMIEIPSITHNVNGCDLNLQIVGVRSYGETNLLGNSSQKEAFQLGIGFLNRVCCNMSLSTNGVNSSIKVTNTADLYRYAIELFSQYNSKLHIDQMRRLNETTIDVRTFAQFLGKCRLYSALPQRVKTELKLLEMILNEAQINAAVRDYYTDENFGGGENGTITAWQLYNLITNYKNNYIDTTLDRSVNAFEVVSGITRAINGIDSTWNWFIE
ncbi:MAG: DUF3871 family protein [Rikenellaceae bacterium]